MRRVVMSLPALAVEDGGTGAGPGRFIARF